MRTSALDWALLIGNMCALYDHKQEEKMNLLEEYGELPDIEKDQETLTALLLDIEWDIVLNEAESAQLLTTRRQLQEEFFKEFNIDKEYWCQFKHWCTMITSVQEVSDAHSENHNITILKQNLLKQFYSFLWKITGVWPADCGRCLTDRLTEDQEEDLKE